MKYIFSSIGTIAALVVLSLIAYFGYRWIDNYQKTDLAKRTVEIVHGVRQTYASEAEAERAKEDVLRRERETKKAELSKKQKEDEDASREKALKLLKAYLGRQEKLLKDTMEESAATVGLILEDQKTLSDALKKLEAENQNKAEVARKRKKKRYDKADRVMNLLNSPELNELASKYLGEDFSAMASEYKSRMSTLLSLQSETSSRLVANRNKFEKTVEGIDEEVDEKNKLAARRSVDARRDLERSLVEIKKKREDKQRELDAIRQRRVNRSNIEEIEKLRGEIAAEDAEIARIKQILSVSMANVAQNEAATYETRARRKYDSALATRQDEDNAVHAEMAHRRSVFNLAVEYENRSLDLVRTAMKRRVEMMELRSLDAKKKLDYIALSAQNADFMNASELENLRKGISKKLAEKVLTVTE